MFLNEYLTAENEWKWKEAGPSGATPSGSG